MEGEKKGEERSREMEEEKKGKLKMEREREGKSVREDPLENSLTLTSACSASWYLCRGKSRVRAAVGHRAGPASARTATHGAQVPALPGQQRCACPPLLPAALCRARRCRWRWSRAEGRGP